MSKKSYTAKSDTNIFNEDFVTVEDNETGEWVRGKVNTHTDFMGYKSYSVTDVTSSQQQRRDMAEAGASFGVFAVVALAACLVIIFTSIFYQSLPALLLSSGNTLASWAKNAAGMVTGEGLNALGIITTLIVLFTAIILNIKLAAGGEAKSFRRSLYLLGLLLCVPCIISLYSYDAAEKAGALSINSNASLGLYDVWENAKSTVLNNFSKSTFDGIITVIGIIVLPSLLGIAASFSSFFAIAAAISIPFAIAGKKQNLKLLMWYFIVNGFVLAIIGLGVVWPGLASFLESVAEGAGNFIEKIYNELTFTGMRSGASVAYGLRHTNGWLLLAIGLVLIIIGFKVIRKYRWSR